MVKIIEPMYIGPGVCECCGNRRRRLVRTGFGAMCDTCTMEAIRSLRRAGGLIRRARIDEAEAAEVSKGGAVR